MAAVAERAGVAAGTAYVHYASKDDLIIATYVQIKVELGYAALEGVTDEHTPHERFMRVWRNIHDHLAADPAQARYLAQLEASPYFERAHERLRESDDPLIAATDELREGAIDLPARVLWDLAAGPAIRLAADPGTDLDEAQLDLLAEACWRAVSQPA